MIRLLLALKKKLTTVAVNTRITPMPLIINAVEAGHATHDPQSTTAPQPLDRRMSVNV